uniref:Uncharacterized protein n=1 Tax=Heterobasidion irregulare TaxID=984962 RepID=A0A075DE76_9AGAM|nr:hypothetical protein [Heterobasidion irregulare]AHK09753.1 hypothetical protein [Heterobasidion irregulare]
MNYKLNMININKFTTKLNTDKENIIFIFVLNSLFFFSLQYNFNYTIDFLSTDYLSLPLLISLTSAHRTTENILNKIKWTGGGLKQIKIEEIKILVYNSLFLLGLLSREENNLFFITFNLQINYIINSIKTKFFKWNKFKKNYDLFNLYLFIFLVNTYPKYLSKVILTYYVFCFINIICILFCKFYSLVDFNWYSFNFVYFIITSNDFDFIISDLNYFKLDLVLSKEQNFYTKDLVITSNIILDPIDKFIDDNRNNFNINNFNNNNLGNNGNPGGNNGNNNHWTVATNTNHNNNNDDNINVQDFNLTAQLEEIRSRHSHVINYIVKRENLINFLVNPHWPRVLNQDIIHYLQYILGKIHYESVYFTNSQDSPISVNSQESSIVNSPATISPSPSPTPTHLNTNYPFSIEEPRITVQQIFPNTYNNERVNSGFTAEEILHRDYPEIPLTQKVMLKRQLDYGRIFYYRENNIIRPLQGEIEGFELKILEPRHILRRFCQDPKDIIQFHWIQSKPFNPYTLYHTSDPEHYFQMIEYTIVNNKIGLLLGNIDDKLAKRTALNIIERENYTYQVERDLRYYAYLLEKYIYPNNN